MDSPSLSTTPVSSSVNDTSGKLEGQDLQRAREPKGRNADPLSHFAFSSVGKQIVNVPSFVVRLDSQKHIDFSLTSPYGGARAGRVKRKRAKAAAAGSGDAEEEDEE